MQAIKAFVLISYLTCCLLITTTTAQHLNNNRADTKIIRVRNLREDERQIEGTTEKTRSVYLVNILPIPLSRRNNENNPNNPEGADNEVRQRSFQNDPRGRVPALFFLQKVKSDEDNLPDGIYYRPAADSEPPQPVIQKDISRLHAFALGRTPVGGNFS